MKYLKEATLKSGAWWKLITWIMLTILYSTVNANILTWISNAIAEYNHPFEWVTYVVMGCIINMIIGLIITYTTRIGQSEIYTYLHNKICKTVILSDYELYTKYNPGELSAIIGSIEKIAKVVQTLLSLISSMVTVAVTLVVIARTSVITIIPILVLYGTGSIFIIKINKKWNEIDKDMDDTRRTCSSKIDEAINGFNEVRSYPGEQKRLLEEVYKLNELIMNKLKKRVSSGNQLIVIIDSIDSIVTIGLLCYAITALQNGTISSSISMSLIMFGWRLIEPVVTITQDLSDISDYYAPLPKFIEVMEFKNEVSKGTINLNTFESSIKFESVTFSYDDSANVLHDVSFEILKGQSIGICGPSGGGKTTLLKLIPEFYDVDYGRIRIDNIDIRHLTTDSIRKHMGIVHQNPYIFDGTVYDNIIYGDHNKGPQSVLDAAKKASIYEFIMSLPDGFYTKVGPRGLKLSGGQKQRIALARVFLKNPDIIILDEATSALDNETENIIQESLNEFKGKTIITVAHRLSTIRNCDNIIVIDNHEVAEQGTHEELVTANGLYAKMLR